MGCASLSRNPTVTQMATVEVPSESLPGLPEAVNVHSHAPPLYIALCAANFNYAEELIDENRGLLYTDPHHDGNKVLHAAMIHRAPAQLVRKLLEKGANPNEKNALRRSCVYLASRHDVSVETMKLLIQYGGDINMRDRFTYTPLMGAAYNGASLSLVAAMVGLGADIKAHDQLNRIAATWADEGNHTSISVFLNNIMVIPPLCSIYTVKRLGSRSLLKMLPIDMIHLVRDMLVIPSEKKAKDDESVETR